MPKKKLAIRKKRKYVIHRKACTCSIVSIGYTKVAQIIFDSSCPFHKHYLKDN